MKIKIDWKFQYDNVCNIKYFTIFIALSNHFSYSEIISGIKHTEAPPVIP